MSENQIITAPETENVVVCKNIVKDYPLYSSAASKIKGLLGCCGGEVRLQWDPRLSSRAAADSFLHSTGISIGFGLEFLDLDFFFLLHPFLELLLFVFI